MSNRYTIPRVKVDYFGRTKISNTNKDEYLYLLGVNIKDIILFEESTQEMIDKNLPILPRYYKVFVSIKDGVPQFKPYEYDKYRINVEIRDDIIINIDSIG